MANPSTTPAQVVTALTQLRAEILSTLVPGANLPGPALADLLVRQLDELVASINQRGQTRYGVGVPGPALGADNDVYTDTATGYEYQKVAGAWAFRFNKKGAPGTTPVKGRDYVDGEDGIDGTQVYSESYAPGQTTGGQEGYLWYHLKSVSAYDIYKYIDGQWVLVFRKAEGATLPTPSALAATLTISAASVAAGTAVTFTAGASGGTAPYTYLTQATNANTGATANIGSATTGSWTPSVAGSYELTTTVTDSTGATKISAVRTVTVTAAVLPVPAAPSWSFNSQTRVLSLAAPTGYESATLEYKQGSGAYQDYAAGLLTDNAAHNAGEWQGRVKASSTNQAGTPAGSPQIAVAGGSTTPTTLTVTQANQRYNGRAEANNGGTRYYAASVFSVLTDAPSVTVNVYGYNGTTYALPAAVARVGNADLGIIGTFAGGKTGTQSYTISGIPGSGQRQIDLYSAPQLNFASQDTFTSYVSLTEVIIPAGFTGSIVPVVKKTNECLFVFGDSMTQAGGHNDTSMSWPRILNRELRTNSDVYVSGHSSLVGGRWIDTLAKCLALINEFKAVSTGYTKKIFWFDAGVNDAYFHAFTPAQLKQFYIDFAALFLAEVPTGQLYFKSAVVRDNEGPNNLGFPLFAYRDAMQAAVAAIANVRVKYADGLELQKAEYWVDGTHVTIEGDIYVAGTINALLNQTVAGGTLTQVNGAQQGVFFLATTDTTDAVQYRIGGGAWQDSAKLVCTTPGQQLVEAKLVGEPYTTVGKTVTIKPTVLGHSNGVTKVGSGWTRSADNDPLAAWYTDNNGDYYEFVFSGSFSIFQNRQENIAEFTVSVDGGPAVTVPISGPGFQYDIQRVYTSPDYGPGTHTARIESGASDNMNLYYVELAAAVIPANNTRLRNANVTKSAGWVVVNADVMYGEGPVSYTFTVPAGVTGYRIMNATQPNTPGFTVTDNGGAPSATISTVGSGDGQVYEVYRRVGLTGGAHTITIASVGGTGQYMNMYYVELFDANTPA